MCQSYMVVQARWQEVGVIEMPGLLGAAGVARKDRRLTLLESKQTRPLLTPVSSQLCCSILERVRLTSSGDCLGPLAAA